MDNPIPPQPVSTTQMRPPATIRTVVRKPSPGMGINLTPAVFLDRDGTLMEEVEYCKDPEQVTIIDGAREALICLKDAGFKLIIITNQSGIGRGMFTEEEYNAVHAEFINQLGEDIIDATYFCPATPEEDSPRRKPAPGMVFEAMREHRINPVNSFFVGDKAADITCGRRAGTTTVLVRTGYGMDQGFAKPDHTAADILEAVEIILENMNG